MDTENCTNLYLQVCQTLLTCNHDDPASFADLYKLLPWFRQSLTCCVCSSVVKDPMASTESACQHFVCAACNGKPMVLKPSCSWCKDCTYFERNGHLSMLVMCFSKVCELIAGSPIMDHIVKSEKQRNLNQDTRSDRGPAKEFVLGRAYQKKKSRGKKMFPYRSRGRLKQLNFSLTKVLNDGLVLKKDIDLLKWLDKNVDEISDTSAITPAFTQVQAELCLDTALLSCQASSEPSGDMENSGEKAHGNEEVSPTKTEKWLPSSQGISRETKK